MTCKGWEHLWLNEGWASFGEALWNEEAAPANRKKQAYQRTIAGFVSGQRGMNRTYAPAFAPLVSNRYSDPQQTFMKANDVYAKGACVLHILRQTLGDEAFFKGVRLYMDRCKFTCVETDDFRHALEDASGLNLERVFSQWCDRPGLPRLEVSLDWVESSSGGGDMKVKVTQNQRVDADNPAYAFALPLVFKFGDEERKTIKVPVDSKETLASLHFDAKPEDVVVDPDMTVIAPSQVHKPQAMWLRQIDDESVFAQIQAAEALSGFDDAAASAALVRVASDPERVDLVRRAAGAPMAERFRRVLEGILNESPPPGEPDRATFVRANGGGR
jgi:aminopeptidase N